MPAARNTRLRILDGENVPVSQRGRAAMGMLVRVFAGAEQAVAAQVQHYGLKPSQMEVLLNLAGGEGISQQTLAERMLVTKGNTCVLLQKMEADGLIERRIDPTDQRYHRLYLTDAGRRLHAKFFPGHERLLSRILGDLSEKEKTLLLDLLARLNRTLEEINA